MPLHAIYALTTGRILKLASSAALQDGEGSIEVSSDMYQCDLTHHVDGEALVPRPALPGWTITHAPAWLSLAELPEGSSFTVTNESGDALVITSFAEPLQLTDPGIYRISVDLPFPWLPHAQQLILE